VTRRAAADLRGVGLEKGRRPTSWLGKSLDEKDIAAIVDSGACGLAFTRRERTAANEGTPYTGGDLFPVCCALQG